MLLHSAQDLPLRALAPGFPPGRINGYLGGSEPTSFPAPQLCLAESGLTEAEGCGPGELDTLKFKGIPLPGP